MHRDEAFATARLRLTIKKPYLTIPALRVRPVEVKDFPFPAGIDNSWRMYYDPNEWAKWTVDEAAAVLEHEIWHCVRQHGQRGKEMAAVPMIWNISADREIHHDNSIPKRIPKRFRGEEFECITQQNTPAEDGETCESIYKRLIKEAKKVSVSTQSNEGSGVTGERADFEKDPDKDGPGKAESEGIAREVAKDVLKEAAKDPGNVPQDLVRWAEQKLEPPKVKWQSLLASCLRRTISDVQGAIDYSFSRPSRRDRGSPVILPRLRQPVPEVAVATDTSGSMGEEELLRAQSEVEGICKALGRDVTRFSVDTKVHEKKRATSAKGMKLKGGGGTDMGVAIEAINNLHPHPDIGIIITDGYTPWPARAPNAKIIVVLVGRDHANIQSVPGWARAIEIEED